MGKNQRLQAVDLVRSFAILVVMAAHLKPTLFLSQEPWFRFVWDRFQRNGNFGVMIFFVVSGFLISGVLERRSRSLFRPDLKKFYVQRIGRIFPLYFLALLIGAVAPLFYDGVSKLFHYCFGLPGTVFRSEVWLSLLTFTFNWVWALSPEGYGAQINVLWSLSVEEQFYLFFPLSLMVLGNSRRLLVFVAVLAVMAVGWRLWVFFHFENNLGYAIRLTFGTLDSFAMGILLHQLLKQWGGRLTSRPWIAAFVCLAGSILALGVYFGTFHPKGLTPVFGPFFLSIGTMAALLGGLCWKATESRWLSWLALPGKYCYGNYLLHAVVLYFLHPFLVGLHTAVAFLIFVVVTTAVSAASYRSFETPCNHWIRSRFAKAQ